MNILITGGTSGIGKAIADRCEKDGYSVRRIGKSEYDLVKTSERDALVASVAEPLDAVIHSAGIFEDGRLLDQSQDAYEKMYALNVDAVMQLNRGLINKIKRGTGRIVIIGSSAGLEAYNARGRVSAGEAYSVTKWALRGYTYNLREEAKTLGIGVTLISPGSVRTPMWDGTDIPDEKFCSAEDVAELVYTSLIISPRSVVEEITIRPIQGNV